MPAEIIVFVTVSSSDEAEKIALALVEEKLAACVNIIPKIYSIYRWESKIERSAELLLIIKSSKVMLEKIINSVKINHSYKLPEVIAIPVAGGSKDYLDWINSSICLKRNSRKQSPKH